MLSDFSDQGIRPSRKEVVSKIRIQTAILKAIHDFLEEQNFSQILPHTLSKLTHQINQIGEIPSFGKEFGPMKLESDHIVINHQLLLGGLDLERIYSVTSTDEEQALPSHLDLEVKHQTFEDTIVFIEKLLRRIKIDIEKKVENSILELDCPLPTWRNTFPIMSRHDIELEFGDDWQLEATNEIDTPFFISCVDPIFFDGMDPKRKGDHYLNFELYFPNQSTPIVRGGQREFKFDKIMNQMNNLGINRFEFRNYLIQTADSKLQPSSGASINMDKIIAGFTCS